MRRTKLEQVGGRVGFTVNLNEFTENPFSCEQYKIRTVKFCDELYIRTKVYLK